MIDGPHTWIRKLNSYGRSLQCQSFLTDGDKTGLRKYPWHDHHCVSQVICTLFKDFQHISEGFSNTFSEPSIMQSLLLNLFYPRLFLCFDLILICSFKGLFVPCPFKSVAGVVKCAVPLCSSFIHFSLVFINILSTFSHFLFSFSKFIHL